MALIFALTIIIFLFSVILHEVMHGVVARYFGDHTAEDAGRLTLNPIPHIDPVGSILLPLMLRLSGSPILLGWAKPVPVNPLNFKDIRKGELWVSAAGPLTNFGLAIFAAILYHSIPTTPYPIIKPILSYIVDINALLAVFNLIPIPPLDGSKMLMAYLPLNLLKEYQKLERYGFLLILLLWFIPLGNDSVMGALMNYALNLIHSLLGV